jgi:uncharacterized protein YndB with AHSA1/START domain
VSTAATIPAIRRSVTVSAPVARAFEVFTDAFNTWWPPSYHIGEADFAEAVIEPREGGRWYERGVDGSECEWGRVLAWEPPHRLVLTWQINGEWKYDGDPGHASEIEVRFTAEGAELTRVEVEHRLLERLVGGQQMYDAVSAEGGWGTLLEQFAQAVSKES